MFINTGILTDPHPILALRELLIIFALKIHLLAFFLNAFARLNQLRYPIELLGLGAILYLVLGYDETPSGEGLPYAEIST